MSRDCARTGLPLAACECPDGCQDERFQDGWLSEHLRKVVDELRARPKELQPQLTGERARVMETEYWLRENPSD
jgi:hypothetical protein